MERMVLLLYGLLLIWFGALSAIAYAFSRGMLRDGLLILVTIACMVLTRWLLPNCNRRPSRSH